MRMFLRAAIVALTLTALAITGPAVAAQDAEHILILGSSTTACAGDLDTPDHCYINLFKAAHPEDTFTILGRGGTYIAYGTDPAKNWTTTPIPSGHQRVIIQLGINDWYVPVPPAQLRRDIDQLVIRVKTANPGAKIAWVRTWMPSQGDTSDTRKAMWAMHGQYTADAMYYARSATAVGGASPVADFLDMGTSPGPRRSSVASDNGWHYNDRGHAEIAEVVNRWIDQT
jgi:hypothetical protein